MKRLTYYYICENSICGNKEYVNKDDVMNFPHNKTCSCHDNMILVYEEIDEEEDI